MITLNTPIIIYPDTYNAQFFVRIEVELRTQTMTMYLAPARSTDTDIFLGIKETVDGQVNVRFPELMRTVTITQNPAQPDPVIQELFDSYVAFLELAEHIIVDNQHDPGGLATVPYQIGTTEWSLESTWESNGIREVSIENLDAQGVRK